MVMMNQIAYRTPQREELADLIDNEDLAQLVALFTKRRRIETVEQPILPHVLEKERQRIRDTITKLRAEVPFNRFQEEDFATSLRQLADSYVQFEIGLKYDHLDPQLFKLTRTIEVEYSGKYLKTEIPLFATATLTDKEPWKFGHTYERAADRQTFKLSVESRLPPIPKKVKDEARLALAYCAQVGAKALQEPTIGEVYLREYGGLPPFLITTPRLYWIPSPSELHLDIEKLNRDPFLTLNLGGESYLVSRWDVLGEEPFEHYLAEFSSKNLRGRSQSPQ